MIKHPIQAEKIKKSYNGKVVVDLSLAIKRNEVVGIIGKNGSGKTTTLNILAGVIEADSGTVYIDNQARRIDNFKAKKNIAYLPEERQEIEDLTVNEYLTFICQVYKQNKKQISKALTSVNALEYLNKPFNELSKGYQQRVLFAAILLADSKIIILDEMSDGLDPVQRKELYSLVNNLKTNKSIIIASHNIEEITNICDRVYIIKNGKIEKELNKKDFNDIENIL